MSWQPSVCRLLLIAVSVTGSDLFSSRALVASADELAERSSHVGKSAFRRLFVPADSPETWPVGSERFLPIPRQEFERLVGELQHQETGEQQPPVQIVRAAIQAELLPDDVLAGTMEWTVALPDNRPRLLPLSPLNLAIGSAAWRGDPTQPASIGLWKRSDQTLELAALAEQSDTLQLQWHLAAHNRDTVYAEFDLRKPIVVPQTLELLLPANRSATLTDGELLQTDADSSDTTRWMFQLGANETHRLRITRQATKPATNVLPFVSQVTSYRLEASGLEVVTQLRLDARESQISELKTQIGNELRVATVRVDQQPVAWRVDVDDGISTLAISRPDSLKPQAIEIRCLARFRSGAPWTLPKLRFHGVAWTEGSTSLLVSPDLELRRLTPRDATLQHIVGIAVDTHEGEVFRLQESSSAAEIEVEVERPRATLDVTSLTTFELGRSEAKASIVAALASSRTSAYQVQAAIAPRWSIDSVTAIPKSALNEWHIDREASPAVLYCQLNQPITDRRPLRLEIEASETAGVTVLPATVGQLKIIQFLKTTSSHDFLQLQTRQATQIALADRIERARLAPDHLPSELAGLATQSPAGVLIDVAMLSDSEVLALRQQPAQHESDVQIEVVALPDSFRQEYQINCRVNSGAVSELLLEFDSSLPKAFTWAVVGQRGTVTMESIDSTTEPPSAARAVRYLLRLPTPMTSDFRLQASYAQPPQQIERCNLLRLPRAGNWSGRVLLRGSLEKFRVFDMGWTPTLYLSTKADQGKLPLLGAYRIGPTEFRRRSTNPRIQMQRLTAASTVPRLVAWLAEYQTLQSANGAALHIAGYSLENVGIGQAKITLPAGAQLQEAWIDDQQLETKQLSVEGNAFLFRFASEHRWPYLALKFSTYEPQLEGSATIQPTVPECSFPIHLGRWTLWAPEQYEIDNTQQNYSSQRYHWWKRIFGPLARSRGETVFNPSRGASWSDLWSAPLVGQRTRQVANDLAEQLVTRLNAVPSQPLGELFSELIQQGQFDELFCLDRAALFAKGAQPNSSVSDLIATDSSVSLLKSQALPLTSYQLALLVSPGTIVLTTAERVAHWYDQLRPTEVSGMFVVNSDALADRLDEIRSARSTDVVSVSQWQVAPEKIRPQWSHPSAAILTDVGRRAQTIEFVANVPTVVVRRAFVQRALWYVVVLLTLVLGIWQLTHYPNFMILTGALAGAACLIVPTQWLTIPQAVFLGLVAASIVRVTIKSSQIGNMCSDSPNNSTASEISRVLVSRYMVPYYSFVLTDLLHTVGHELTTPGLTVDPVQGYRRVQPAMHFRNFLDLNRCFNICYEFHRHMP